MADKNAGLVVTDQAPTEKLDDSGPVIDLGQWYWYEGDDENGKRLVCVSEIGSNYFKVTKVSEYNGSWRIRAEDFEKVCTRELNPEAYINAKIEEHRHNVNVLLDRVKQLTASLGVAPRDSISDHSQGESTALAVAHGTADIKAHKKALIKAKEKTLPELFKEVEKEHEKMAVWMKAQTLPAKIEFERMKDSIELIDDRIFTVELYAGLTEELVQIQDGEPAPNDTKVSLFQRRHYMDEECLVNYQAGGMNFKSIEAFDEWLLQPENLNRILPLDRCVVSFRIRRHEKERRGYDMSDFIRIMHEKEADKATFLYIRNGQKVFRMETAIDFNEQLFPNKEQSTLLSGDNDLWIDRHFSSDIKVYSQRQYEDFQIEHKKARDKHAKELWKWKREGKKHFQPHFWEGERHTWERCTPESIYYDDAMKQIAKAAMEHNRIAVVLQGLLDRSIAFHPHPPWRLWTMEGFMAGVDLVYDESNALTPGDAPDFEEYRKQLAKSIKRGSLTIGQEDLWLRAMAQKENARRDRLGQSRSNYDLEYFKPYGNPGPGFIAEVASLGRSGTCSFTWERARQTTKWIDDPDNDRYMKVDESTIQTSFTCRVDQLFNVSAYTPGDYKKFFADPRTRAQYLKWAPFMLAAEDYYATGRRNKRDD